MKLIRKINWSLMFAFVFGGGLALVGVLVAVPGIEFSSSSAFCMTCHEMRVVGEQGWMRSPHYRNAKGVVAGCAECHVPPDFPLLLWVKGRDGMWDILVHAFGESDPEKMDWNQLGMSARAKIYDSACERCHQNLTPAGASIKTIAAHRENLRLPQKRRCLSCHRREFHGGFKTYLGISELAAAKGGEK